MRRLDVERPRERTRESASRRATRQALNECLPPANYRRLRPYIFGQS